MKKVRNKQVRVLLEGGTGNQMFMYFAGLAVAKIRNRNLVLDTSKIGKFGTDHGFYLDQINIRASIYSRRGSSLIVKIMRVERFVCRRFRLYRNIKLRIFGYFESTNIGYSELLLNTENVSSIRGYFQSWIYFKLCESLGSARLEIVKPSRDFEIWRAKITREPTIAVHVRKGDYANLGTDFGMLSEEYFVNGIEYLRKIGCNYRVWIFSDEIERVENQFKNSIWKDACYVKNSLNPIENLFLMKEAKAFILSNSTFSYWSALMSQYSYAPIVPDPWFRNREAPENLIPLTWRQMHSSWIDD